MLKELKLEVYNANMELVKSSLVVLTWGNVSSIDRNKGMIVIKPSGVAYSKMTVEDIVVVDMDGNIVDGYNKPSSDTLTHIQLYKAFPDIVSIVHTHSINATAYAQAGKSIPVFGTTHADCFYGEIPCTRELREDEIQSDYERNIGLVIADTFKNINPVSMPAVLVKNHGPFVWGTSVNQAVENAITLEVLSEMALKTLIINKSATHAKKYLIDKHFNRKHGKDAYYGQRNKL